MDQRASRCDSDKLGGETKPAGLIESLFLVGDLGGNICMEL